MTTPNPWTVVPATDYETHMGAAGADQLAPLSQLFQEIYLSAQPDRLLVVGCSTGNGLEHVDPSITKRIVGVDVNLQYLGIARQRFFHLGPALELFCNEVEKFRQPPASFDMIHAALVLEYVQPDVAVRRFADWLAPGGTCSVVLQLPGGHAAECHVPSWFGPTDRMALQNTDVCRSPTGLHASDAFPSRYWFARTEKPAATYPSGQTTEWYVSSTPGAGPTG